MTRGLAVHRARLDGRGRSGRHDGADGHAVGGGRGIAPARNLAALLSLSVQIRVKPKVLVLRTRLVAVDVEQMGRPGVVARVALIALAARATQVAPYKKSRAKDGE